MLQYAHIPWFSPIRMGRSSIPTGPDLQNDFDLVIHCGDLTQGSAISEFRDTLGLLRDIRAPMKVIIAGNHDITLEAETYRKHLSVAGTDSDDTAAVQTYGKMGEARQLLIDAAVNGGMIFLKEGTHKLCLPNGAVIAVYASPWTPRKEAVATGANEAGWAFQYDRLDEHAFNIPSNTDIVVTHTALHKASWTTSTVDAQAVRTCSPPSLASGPRCTVSAIYTQTRMLSW